jgi:AraC-like DNA-binding protein
MEHSFLTTPGGTHADDKSWLIFDDNSLFFWDDMNHLPDEFQARSPEFVMLILCYEGHNSLTMNGQKYEAKPVSCIVCPPDTPMSDFQMSSDVNISVVGFKWDALQQQPLLNKYYSQIYRQILRFPILRFEDRDVSLLDKYYMLILEQQASPDLAFRRESHLLCMQMLALDLLAIGMRIVEKTLPPAGKTSFRQHDLVLERFVNLLAEADGQIRSASVAAARLGMSANYLSRMVKAASGRTPMSWIHEYLESAIVRRLAYSKQTVKEICFELGFPNVSFFCKFVKSRLGVSPMRFRAQHDTVGKNGDFGTGQKF